jgi:hypothetical protein
MYYLVKVDGLYSITDHHGEVVAYAMKKDFAERLILILNLQIEI